MNESTPPKFVDTTGKPEDLLRKMVDEVDGYAILLLDNEGIILHWNKGAEKIKLYAASEVIGQSFAIFFSPEDRALRLPVKLLDQAAKSGNAVHLGWQIRSDQTQFWASVTITALHNNSGDIIGFSEVTQNLSATKNTEDRLRADAESLRLQNIELVKSGERFHRMILEVED